MSHPRIAELNVQVITHTVFTPPLDETGVPIFDPDPETKFRQGEYSGEAAVEFGGRACYQSWEKKNPATATNEGYLTRTVGEQKHLSIAEHAMTGVYVQGVSRALTHELVRHRHFSPSQISQRYVPASQYRLVVPPAFQGVEGYAEHVLVPSFEDALTNYEASYNTLAARGLKGKKAREASRCFLPNMTEAKIVISANYRAWLEFLTKRDDPAADAEMQILAAKCAEALEREAPTMFGPEVRALLAGEKAQGENTHH